MRRLLQLKKLIFSTVGLTVIFSFSVSDASALDYIVKPGDTLEKIAGEYGVTVEELAAINNIENKDIIFIGSKLDIPDSSLTSSFGLNSESSSDSGTMTSDNAELTNADQNSLFSQASQEGPDNMSVASEKTKSGQSSEIVVSKSYSATKSAKSGAAGTSGKSVASQNTSENTITINVAEADVRDVLSALALNMGRNIIFKGTPSKITVKIDNVEATEALELVARMAGLIYVEEDTVIIVGDRDIISSDFNDHVEIAEFKLKFITADTLAEQIMTLGLRVEHLSVRSNSKTLWVQGFASDLVKIRQIIRMLDKNANVELGSAEITSCFRAIHVEYISADELRAILAQLSLPSGFTLEGNPNTLYVYASNEDFASINSVKAVVDVVENFSLEGSYFTSKKIELYKLKYVTSESVVSLFEEITSETDSSLDISVVYTNGLRKAVWLCGSVDAIIEAKEIIEAVDVPEMNALSRIQVFRLYNVTASEMEKKLQMLAIPELTIYTFPYSAFSKSILVSCPGDFMSTVSEMIDTLDKKSPSVTLPVDSSDVENGSAKLYNRRILISELSGIPISSFKISSNIAKDNGYRYVMYLTASPEEIQRVKDIIAEIDGV